MYYVSIHPDKTINHVYDDLSLDPDLEKFPITDEEFNLIDSTKSHGMWLLEGGKIISNKNYVAVVSSPIGSNIPQSVL